jgi:hypothetical protein
MCQADLHTTVTLIAPAPGALALIHLRHLGWEVSRMNRHRSLPHRSAIERLGSVLYGRTPYTNARTRRVDVHAIATSRGTADGATRTNSPSVSSGWSARHTAEEGADVSARMRTLGKSQEPISRDKKSLSAASSAAL